MRDHNHDVAHNDTWNDPPEDDPICVVDVDESYSLAVEVEGGSDGVYFTADKSETDGKWYASAMIDTDSNHNVDDLFVDDGPHDTYTDACFAALQRAYDWCVEQGMDVAELDKQHDGLSQAIPLDETMIRKTS